MTKAEALAQVAVGPLILRPTVAKAEVRVKVKGEGVGFGDAD